MPDTARSRFVAGVGGVALHVLDVPAKAAVARSMCVVVHGYCEHGGRYVPFAERLAEAGHACQLLDLRGHGRSEGSRGHVDRFADYTGDVARVLASVPSELPTFLFGHSLGGLIALRTVQQGLPQAVAGLLLSNPYLANAMPIGRGKRLLGQIAARLYPRLKAPTGIKGEYLTRDAAALAAVRADPLMFATATAGWFAAVEVAQREALANNALAVPLWLGLGMADPIASAVENERFAASLRTSSKHVARYPDALHELLQDTVRQQVESDLLAWLEQTLPRGQQPA